jgi:hypothetical protein
MGTWRRIIKVIPRAVMLGFGTLFQSKTNADDHWSVSPKVVIVEELQAEGSGAPPGRLPEGLPRTA